MTRFSSQPHLVDIRLLVSDQTAVQAETPRDLNMARFIDLMLPISFKPLLKYLRRYCLVNYGKPLERKRGGYTHNIGINGL
jgi:hypothetical protein